MVKHTFLITSFCLSTLWVVAQHDHGSHQNQNKPLKESASQAVVESHSQKQLAQLLSTYFNIKNALVVGDAQSAASNALEFVKTVNTIDYKVISEGNSHILAKDAGRISATKDVKKQREHFAVFSDNMILLAKAFKLSGQPVYLQYCPMKKASWLSSEKEIRNPYYGSSMLTCGEVIETL